jgi:hypothetical protein
VSFIRFDSIPFDMTAYVDSHVDYGEKLRSGRTIQKFFVDPNNRLGIYKILHDKGIWLFNDSMLHEAEIIVKDVYGNESLMNFHIQSIPAGQDPEAKPLDPKTVSIFNWNRLNVYENEDVIVVVPENALYNDIPFQYERKAALPQSISDTFCIHNIYTPLHASYILSIRPGNLPESLRNKVMIASRDKDGNMVSHDGNYSEGYVTTRLNRFGAFYLALDTIAPSIVPVSFSKNRQYAEGQKISFRITDLESGIRTYNGTIDGEWALFIYDPKEDLISYSIDGDRLQPSQVHSLEIIVTDGKENISHFISDFQY